MPIFNCVLKSHKKEYRNFVAFSYNAKLINFGLVMNLILQSLYKEVKPVLPSTRLETCLYIQILKLSICILAVQNTSNLAIDGEALIV